MPCDTLERLMTQANPFDSIVQWISFCKPSHPTKKINQSNQYHHHCNQPNISIHNIKEKLNHKQREPSLSLGRLGPRFQSGFMFSFIVYSCKYYKLQSPNTLHHVFFCLLIICKYSHAISSRKQAYKDRRSRSPSTHPIIAFGKRNLCLFPHFIVNIS